MLFEQRIKLPKPLIPRSWPKSLIRVEFHVPGLQSGVVLRNTEPQNSCFSPRSGSNFDSKQL